IDTDAATAYRPFVVIESIRVRDGDATLDLRPLVIFHDAHCLPSAQLQALIRWLVRRELKIARWILMRLDALTPTDVLTVNAAKEGADEPGLKRSREMTSIWLQSSDDRSLQRRSFRKMAKGMANRYLQQMEVFN